MDATTLRVGREVQSPCLPQLIKGDVIPTHLWERTYSDKADGNWRETLSTKYNEVQSASRDHEHRIR